MGKAPNAIEIAVSFAGTLLQVTRVPAGGSYRIGTARGVDLPLDISPLTSFPLVGTTPHGFVVRCPAGVSAVMYTRERTISIVESELALEPGARVDLAAGRVTISISQVDDVPTPLELRPIERRPFAFAAASLVAHVAVVIIALLGAQLDPIRAPAAFPTPKHESWKLTRLVPPRPPPQKRKVPRRAAAARQAEPAGAGEAQLEQRPARVAAARLQAREAGMFSNPNLFDFSAIIGDVNLHDAFEGVGPIYDEEAANQGNFGNSGGHFDPTKDPRFDSVKTGRYATTGTGRGAGAHYKLRGEVERPEFMALTCDDNNCVVSGTMNRFQVRDVIEHRYVDLLACYTRNAKAVPRVEVSLQFEISTDGHAGEVSVEGLEPVGNCVKRLVARAKFPTADQPTLVKRYTMAFWRNAPA